MASSSGIQPADEPNVNPSASGERKNIQTKIREKQRNILQKLYKLNKSQVLEFLDVWEYPNRGHTPRTELYDLIVKSPAPDKMKTRSTLLELCRSKNVSIGDKMNTSQLAYLLRLKDETFVLHERLGLPLGEWLDALNDFCDSKITTAPIVHPPKAKRLRVNQVEERNEYELPEQEHDDPMEESSPNYKQLYAYAMQEIRLKKDQLETAEKLSENYEKRLDNSMKDIRLMEDQLEKATNRLENYEKLMENSMQEMRLKENQLEKATKRLEKNEKWLEKSMQEIRLKEEQLEKATKSLENYEQRLEESIQEIRVKDDQLEQATKRLENYEELLDSSINKNRSSDELMAQAANMCDTVNSQLDKVRNGITELKQTLSNNKVISNVAIPTWKVESIVEQKYPLQSKRRRSTH